MLLTRPYFRERAVEYAKRWALSRNPLFLDFTGQGGDCTSFVSQSILAGCCTENYTKTFGWYYISPEDRAPAWSGVDAFYDFMTGSGDFPNKLSRVGPLGLEVRINRLEIGDVVQLYNTDNVYYHSLIVSEITDNEIFVCAHSDDSLDRPLSTYVNAAGVRYIHIQAALIEVDDDTCFNSLINGVEE